MERDEFFSEAGIVFDVNRPILTPRWTNTVDTGLPDDIPATPPVNVVTGLWNSHGPVFYRIDRTAPVP